MEIINRSIQFFENYDNIILDYLIHFGLAILIFIVGRFISIFVSNQLRKILILKQVEPTIIKFTASSSRYTIMGLTLVAVLGQLGVQTSSIVAIIGAAGLAIGLALQGSLSNFAAGVLLILFRPFKVGELVMVSNIRGTVDAIQIFSTTILTPTGEAVTIPNSHVLATSIINFTRQPNRRIDLTIGIDYKADIKQVYQILLSSVERTPNITKDLGIIIRLDELAASSVNFLVMVWTNNDNYGPVRTLILENIKMDLDHHNINIPYQTLDVNIKQ